MIYFYGLFAVAFIAAIALIFWSRSRQVFSGSKSLLESPENAGPLKARKTRRMSLALTKWVSESANQVPVAAGRKAAAAPPEPVSPPAAATTKDWTRPAADRPSPSTSATSGRSSSAASADSSATGAKESDEPYNWHETFGAHAASETNYYEILQISPNADMETIHRVYRIMASRFHPDNPRTGNVERFYVLSKAFEVLSNPAKRLAYDANFRMLESEPAQIFRVEDFVDGVKGEENRRLGVLSLLYNRRRIMEDSPGLSLLELERRMAVPREYLHFTIWYLRSKEYVRTLESNSDLALTAEGVDYVEKHSSTNRVIRELLTAGQEEAEARGLDITAREETEEPVSGAARFNPGRSNGD